MIDQSIYQHFIKDIPELQVEEVQIYHHIVWIKTNLGIGVSSIAGQGFCPPPKDVGQLASRNLKELAELFLSDNYLEVAIGMAAINCYYNQEKKLASHFAGIREDFNAYDYLLTEGKGKNLAVIGGFPFVDKLRPRLETKNIWVFELNPTKDYHLPVTRYDEFLPQADMVILTATTLLNRTFHTLLPYMKNSFNILTGPTTPLTPILFDLGISALSGMVVKDEELAKKYFSQGAASKDALGVKKITLTAKEE